MGGWKDIQTLLHRILPATTRGLTSTTAVDWHLKVKDKEYGVGLTKNYCITVSMQKISSIHTLILKGCVCYILLVCFLSLKESTYETRKNVFYFTSKALFVLKKIKF